MSAEKSTERDRMIGLSAPEPMRRDRVHVGVWDTGVGTDEPTSVRRLGTAAFTVAEARAFAEKLVRAADRAEAER